MPRLFKISLKTLQIFSLSLIVSLAFSQQVDAKRKKGSATSPVKISDVVVSPDPFILGKSPLKLTLLVELPSSLRGANVLEVSAMITSPTRRSMSFVAHRLLVDELKPKGKNPTIPVELVWDGKDQYHQLVADGSYFYELQAKLMEDQGNGPRTKIVSRRVHGTLEALAYVGEVLPPLPPEPDIPEELEILREGESSEESGPNTDEDVKSSDDPAVSEEEAPMDAAGVLLPEEAGGSEADTQIGEPEEKDESITPEMGEPLTSEPLSEPMPALPTSGEELPLVR
ncbi:hypothetical protein [Candidatus Nitrospira neomarina]|uniref:Uncharacterized protein n=1 Tax=Candidatus Nitrospira neomarina TaxID=3020899 RepID=A0AA96GF90_9BACT|nr:hypothetical protein [Candidatus Nitrospira neomarina]WNM61194.1 hypothetical protein PQG83_15745 [Candidatus Nitrospira neomarina]